MAEASQLALGDILEHLGPEELRNILFAGARESEKLNSSLRAYFNLLHGPKTEVSFAEFCDNLGPFSHTDDFNKDDWEKAMKSLVSKVGPNSSWATKQNAIFALRARGKAFERLYDDDNPRNAVINGIRSVLDYLSTKEMKLLFQHYSSLNILTDFKVDLRCDLDPDWMPAPPDWTERPSIRSLTSRKESLESEDVGNGPKSARELLQEGGGWVCPDPSCKNRVCSPECAFRKVFGYGPAQHEEA